MNWMKSPAMNRSTQLYEALIGHARQRHDAVFIACTDTAAKLGRLGLVLNTSVPTGLFTLEFPNSSLFQFLRCHQAFIIIVVVVVTLSDLV